jgi:hypothetical protein
MSVTDHLSTLVTELTKSKPDQQVIKLMCEKTGYVYSSDLIQLMSDILISKNHLKLIQKNKKHKMQQQVGV